MLLPGQEESERVQRPHIELMPYPDGVRVTLERRRDHRDAVRVVRLVNLAGSLAASF